jgi:hypothetical protein
VTKKAALITIAFMALVLIAVALRAYMNRNTGDSVPGAREAVLRENLFVMRSILDQYAVDLHKRPSHFLTLWQPDT